MTIVTCHDVVLDVTVEKPRLIRTETMQLLRAEWQDGSASLIEFECPPGALLSGALPLVIQMLGSIARRQFASSGLHEGWIRTLVARRDPFSYRDTIILNIDKSRLCLEQICTSPNRPSHIVEPVAASLFKKNPFLVAERILASLLT